MGKRKSGGFGCIAAFSVLTSLFIVTASPVVLAIVYIPVICGSALVIGPVQSFALSKLPPQMNPHGVTVMSTGFQIAGCFGSSVFTGVYALVGATTAASGVPEADAAAAGMVASGALVGAFALVGFGLALWIRKIAKAPVTVAAGAPDETGWQHEGAQGASSAAGCSDADAAAAACAAERPMDGSQSSDAALEASVAPASALTAIMKTDVFAVSPHTTVVEAMELFAAKGISGAPVVDDDRHVVGFVSDGDIMGCLADQVPAFKTAWSFVVERDNADFDATLRAVMALPVQQIATEHVITVNLDNDLGEVARVLAERHLKKAPVIDNGRMVGIVNRSNITRYAIARYHKETEGPTA